MDYEVIYNFVGFVHPAFFKLDFLLKTLWNLHLDVNLAPNKRYNLEN